MMKELVKNKKTLLGGLICVFALSMGAAAGSGAISAQAETQGDFIPTAYVTLNEDIVVRYELNVPAGYTKAKATYTYKGKTYTMEKAVTEGEKNVLSFAEVTPVNIGENVALTVTLSGDGMPDLTDSVETFSVADYCKTLLNSKPSSFDLETDGQYDAMRALAANLVAYSGALQTYNKVEDTATANLTTAAQKGFVQEVIPTESDLAFAGEAAQNVGWTGASLLLDSQVNMAFYFSCAETISSVTLDITKSDGDTVTVSEFAQKTVNGKPVYCGVWEGVSVVDFDKTFTAQLKLNGEAVGQSVTYSVKSYVYNIMQNSQNEAMKNLSVALYNYGLTARKYIDALAADTTRTIETSTTVASDPASSLTDPAVSVSTEKTVGWKTIAGRGYTASLTTDGTYFYNLAYGGATKNEETGKYFASFRFVKLDKNFNVLGYSADFTGPATGGQYGGYEYNTPLWVKDGHVWSYNGAGNTVRVEIDKLTGNGTGNGVALEVCEEKEAVAFGGITDVTTVNAVDYVAAKGAFVVISGQTTLSVYAASDLTTPVATQTINSAKWRLATDESALYLTISQDGWYNPEIYVFDWSLNKIGSMKVGVTAEMVDTIVDETDHTKLSKVEGIAVKDGKLYLSLIGWSPLPAQTMICETTFQKTTNLSFGEIALSDYAYTTSAESASGGYFAPSGNFIYNIIEKNGYLYIASGASYGSLRITRYKPNTKSIVAQTAEFTVGVKGLENVAMFAYGENLYVYTSSGWQSVSLNFASEAAWTAVDTLPINLGSDGNKSGFVNIWYWEAEQKTVLYRGDRWVVLLDKNGAELKAWKMTDVVAGGSVPRFGGDDAGYVYVTANNQGVVNPVVTIIDLRTYKKTTLTLPSVAENGATSKIESVFGYNGSVYFSVLHCGDKAGSNIQKVSYADVKTAQPAPSVDLGEAIELAAKNGVSLTLRDKETPTLTFSGLSTTVKGVVSDGTYFYFACRSEGEKTFLVKTTKNGVIMGKTAAFSGTGDQFGDSTYLLYHEGYVYAYGASNGESVYRIKADAFTLDGTATVETTTLPFTAGVGVSAAAHEKTSGRYAVRSGNTLILIGADGKVYKTVTGAVGDKVCGVVCDEHYIYLMYEKKTGIAFNVFDWKGNKVGTFSQDGLISETTEANIPSMWIENGKVYIFAKPWGSTSMYVYVVDLASLNFLPTV